MHLKHSFVKCTREQRTYFPHSSLSHCNNNFLKKRENYKILSCIRNRGLPNLGLFRVTTVHAGKKWISGKFQ